MTVELPDYDLRRVIMARDPLERVEEILEKRHKLGVGCIDLFLYVLFAMCVSITILDNSQVELQHKIDALRQALHAMEANDRMAGRAPNQDAGIDKMRGLLKQVSGQYGGSSC